MKKLVLNILVLIILSAFVIVTSGCVSLKDKLVSSGNNSLSLETMKEVDYARYLKKIWVVKAWNGEAYQYFSFFINKIADNTIQGKLCKDEIAYPDFYFYSLEPSKYLGDLSGTLNNGVAECKYEDKFGNKGIVTLAFNEDDEIEAKITYTDKEEALKNDLIDSDYKFRPYNLADREDFIPSKENSFAVDLNSWGSVKLITGEIDHGAKKYPAAYLSNEHGDILYAFQAPFQTASKLTSASIKDINGDGLKDVILTTEFIEDPSIEHIKWTFYQMSDGLFYDSEVNSN